MLEKTIWLEAFWYFCVNDTCLLPFAWNTSYDGWPLLWGTKKDQWWGKNVKQKRKLYAGICAFLYACMYVRMCVHACRWVSAYLSYLGSISTYARMHAYLYYYASMKSSMHVNVSVYTYVTHGWLMLAELSSQTIHVWKKDQNIGAKDIGRVGWSLVGLLTLMSCLTCVI